MMEIMNLKIVDGRIDSRKVEIGGVVKMSELYFTAEEVAEIMGYSVRGGYSVIQRLNEELKAQGYIIRAGRVPRKYFYERTGLDQEVGT